MRSPHRHRSRDSRSIIKADGSSAAQAQQARPMDPYSMPVRRTEPGKEHKGEERGRHSFSSATFVPCDAGPVARGGAWRVRGEGWLRARRPAGPDHGVRAAPSAARVPQRESPAPSPALLPLTPRPRLQSSPSLRYASYTSLTRSFFPEYRTFADFLASWLLFARDADVDSEDPARAASAYQLLDAVYRSVLSHVSRRRCSDAILVRSGADKVFSQGDTGWFVPTLRVLTTTLVELALKVRSFQRVVGAQLTSP